VAAKDFTQNNFVITQVGDEKENKSSTIFFERDSTSGRKRAKEKQESQLHKAKDLE